MQGKIVWFFDFLLILQSQHDLQLQDAVVFRTCLYVGAAAFITEFQGSPLVRREYDRIETEEIVLFQLKSSDKSPKTANIYFFCCDIII